MWGIAETGVFYSMGCEASRRIGVVDGGEPKDELPSVERKGPHRHPIGDRAYAVVRAAPARRRRRVVSRPTARNIS